MLGVPKTWLLQTWLLAFFKRKRSFVPFCALLRSVANLRFRSFALFCVFLRPTAFRTTAFGNLRFPWKWLGVLEGGCLGRGLFVFRARNHENHGNHENDKICNGQNVGQPRKKNHDKMSKNYRNISRNLGCCFAPPSRRNLQGHFSQF